MFRWGATVIACLGLATMTGCGLGIEGESPEVSFKSKAEERGAEGETHSGKPGGPSGSGDHETGAQLSGDTLKSSDEGTGGGGSSSGEQATTAREGNTETTGVLPKPGPFDPTAPGFELFDPCSEIPESRLHALQISMDQESGVRDSSFKYCGFRLEVKDQPKTVLGISAEKATQTDISSSLGVFVDTFDLGTLRIEYVADSLFPDSVCHALYESPRGTIDMTITASGGASSIEDRCKELHSVVTKLI